LEERGVDGILALGVGEGDVGEGKDEAGETAGSLEEDGSGVGVETMGVVGEGEFEEGGEFVGLKAGDFDAEGDAAEEGEEMRGGETGAEEWETGEEDGEEGLMGEKGFGEGAELGEGFVWEGVGFVDPEEETACVFLDGLGESLRGFGVGASGLDMEMGGEDAGEALGGEMGMAEVKDSIAGAVEAVLEVAEECGFAGSGFSGEEEIAGVVSESGEELVSGVSEVGEIEEGFVGSGVILGLGIHGQDSLGLGGTMRRWR